MSCQSLPLAFQADADRTGVSGWCTRCMSKPLLPHPLIPHNRRHPGRWPFQVRLVEHAVHCIRMPAWVLTDCRVGSGGRPTAELLGKCRAKHMHPIPPIPHVLPPHSAKGIEFRFKGCNEGGACANIVKTKHSWCGAVWAARGAPSQARRARSTGPQRLQPLKTLHPCIPSRKPSKTGEGLEITTVNQVGLNLGLARDSINPRVMTGWRNGEEELSKCAQGLPWGGVMPRSWGWGWGRLAPSRLAAAQSEPCLA